MVHYLLRLIMKLACLVLVGVGVGAQGVQTESEQIRWLTISDPVPSQNSPG